MADDVIGRDEELAVLRRFVADSSQWPAALVVEGEPGIGKTTLWQAGVAVARESGCMVLASRPAEADARLAFSGLADLLGDVVGELVEEIPRPQADALRAALLLDRSGDAQPGERAVFAAVLSALRALAGRRPVLVAVDDIQWLDGPSASALAYAWRRVGEERIGLLAARRSGTERPAVIADAHVLEVEALSVGAVHRLLHARLDLVLSRPVLRRLHEVAAGNPFFALELGRALQRAGATLVPGQPLPVPHRLSELIHGRLEGLPPPTRAALEVVAALSQPKLGVVSEAAEGEEALGPAFEAHVLELEGERIRFAHPLIAATVYEGMSAFRRRELHGRLAALVDDEEETARHLALAAAGPDASVAAALERAATRARSRGATAAAADLCEQARDLTPPESELDLQRRAIVAARYHFVAGDTERARRLLEEALASAAAGPLRAEALAALGRIHAHAADPREAAELYRMAVADAGERTVLRAEAARGVAMSLLLSRERLETALEHAALAVDLAHEAGDDVLYAGSLMSKGQAEGLLGRAEAAVSLERAVRVAAMADDDRGTGGPEYGLATYLVWTDRFVDAARRLRRLDEDARARGVDANILSLPYGALAEYLTGRWVNAESSANEGYERALQAGLFGIQAFSLSVRSLVRASRGLEDEARADADAAMEIAGNGGAIARIIGTWAVGLLEVSLDRPLPAILILQPLREWQLAQGHGEPGALRFIPDEIEALIALGRLDEAESVLAWLEERARALDRASALAAAARSKGLAAAARGRWAEALASFERALEQHERVTMPFERARTLLAQGSVQRRANRRAAARQTLGEALAAFEELGAAIWAQRARDELARIGGRSPSSDELTPSERRVAELVVEGRTNREVAAALFVTPRTVETHLSHVYRKLGVRSRTELARRFSTS